MKKTLLNLSLIGLISPAVLASSNQSVSLSKGEVCEISADLNLDGGESYIRSDRKDVKKLCSYDTHITVAEENGADKAVGVCTKLNSTFPAVEFMKIRGSQSKAQVEAGCNKKIGAKNSGKIAKYKYSMSCANTSSIIGYYHVSRALGIKFVPPTVLRTMDIDSHIAIAKKAVKTVGGDSQLISKNWRSLLKKLQNRDSAITSEDGKMSFGALSVNPRGEQKTYDGIYLGGDGQGQRLTNFMNSSKSTYRKLRMRKPIGEIVNTQLTDSNYTTIQQMKDVADMIVLDTIFGQKDRFANTHSIYTWLVVESDGKLKKYTLKDIEKMMAKEVEQGVAGAEKNLASLVNAKEMAKDWRKEIRRRLAKIRTVVDGYLADKGLQFAFAENLMLKDNDCGLKDSNPFARRDVIGDVYHISPETYRQLMKLHRKVNVEQSMDGFLKHNFAMNSADMAKFKKGLSHVATDLKVKNDQGTLFQDLVVKAHFKPEPREVTAEGLPVHKVVRSGVNVRTARVLEVGTTEESLYKVSGVGQVTQAGDKVAIIKSHPPVGNNTFIEVKVVESKHLPIGATVFLWSRSIR